MALSSATALSSALESGHAGCCAADKLLSKSESSDTGELDIGGKRREGQSGGEDQLTEEDFCFGKKRWVYRL